MTAPVASSSHLLDPKQFLNIPESLRARPQWVVWRREARADGSTAKVPYQALDPAARASSTDPSTWAAFLDAVGAISSSGDLDGLGYMVAPDEHLVMVDVDHEVSDAGELTATAQDIVATLATYTERSPSGEGIHAFVIGAKPGPVCRRGHVEMYDRARFFTMTGAHVPGTPTTVAANQAGLDAVYATYLAPASSGRVDSDGAGAAPPSLDDREVLQLARGARNGDKFRLLYDGGWQAAGLYDADDSRADLALCSMLAFWTQDRVQIDRLFRASSLIRDKWDTRRGHQTYGEQTIERALADVQATHGSQEQPRGVDVNAPPKSGFGAYLARAVSTTRPQLIKTGIPSLDIALHGGYAPGQLVVVPALTRVGKTIVMNQQRLAMIRADHPVVSFECEMTADQIYERLWALVANAPLRELSAAYYGEAPLTPERRAYFERMAPALDNLPLYVRDDVRSVTDMERIVAARPGTKVVTIDLLQRLRPPHRMDVGRFAVEANIGALKDMALRYNIVVILASHIARPLKTKPAAPVKDEPAKPEKWDKQREKARAKATPAKAVSTLYFPSVDSARESAEIEGTADVVLLIARDPDATDAATRQTLHWRIGKNRRATETPWRQWRLDLTRLRVLDTKDALQDAQNQAEAYQQEALDAAA